MVDHFSDRHSQAASGVDTVSSITRSTHEHDVKLFFTTLGSV